MRKPSTSLFALLLSVVLFSDSAVAQQGPLEFRPVVARGRTEPAGRIHNVAAPSRGGTVAELRVAEGARVARGDVLAVLGSYATRAAVTLVAEQAVIAARLQLDRIRSEETAAELDGLAASVTMRAAELGRAERMSVRSQSLTRGNYVSEEAHELRVLDLQRAREALRKAQADLRQATERVRLDEQAALARIEQSVAELTRARADQEEDLIRAPIDGTVLTLTARRGETIGPDGLLSMADLSRFFIMAELDADDASRVAPGDAASVTSRTWSEPVAGRVVRVAHRVFRSDRPTTDVFTGRDARIVEAEIAVDSPAQLPAVLGLEVTVTITARRLASNRR
jgi:HlyD family secretion protein